MIAALVNAVKELSKQCSENKILIDKLLNDKYYFLP
jgi:hypothetical protein